MASAFTYKLNIAEVHNNIKDAKDKAIEIVRDELSGFGLNVVEDAKRFAPVDEGVLRNNINFAFPVSDKGFRVDITVNVPYAAYIEFGTKKYAAAEVAKLPPEWKTFAAQFKGRAGSGSFDEFVQNIMEWVQRKGIGALKTKSGNNSKSADSLDAMQQAAYWIALNIIQNGIHAHPYLYPAFKKNKDEFIANLKKQLSG